LHKLGNLPEAVSAYRRAVQLNPDFALAHCNLGSALMQQGQFADALTALRRGHELGSQQQAWPHPSHEWAREAERLVKLDAKLLRVLSGEIPPADAVERRDLAQLCVEHKGLYAASARLFEEAFAAQPTAAEGDYRYNAACAAALAGSGQGKDAAQLTDPDRARLRRQALAWLRAEFSAWERRLEGPADQARAAVRQRMEIWLKDADLARVRGAEALAKLPEPERREWQQLWADVEALRQRAAGEK
jgi:tetratricopeptide (TPR) repeat protein